MVRWRSLAAALLALWGLAASGVLATCPGGCDCKLGSAGSVVHCRYQHLQGFPDAALFPADTIELDYGHNNISAMTEFPRLPNLQTLVLDNCEIRTIGSRAFANVPALRNLTLNKNKIEKLERTAFQGLPDLQGLYLENNKFKVLPGSVFEGLTLQDLYLEGNAIDRLEDDVFIRLSVQHLNMKSNNLSRLTSTVLRNLQTSLVSFHLDHNGRELIIDVDTFEGFTALEVLSVRSSHLKDLAFLENIQNVKTLYLSGNRFSSLDLRSYRSLASVETLGLADMGLQSFSARQVLSGLSALRQLDLSNNGIVMMSGAWFQYTPRITSLNLSGNRFFQLPHDLGLYLTNIESLDLAMNGLRSIRTESFEGMQNLNELDIRNNKIQVFSEQIKPLFQRIRKLMLEGNPLHCNCEMAWYLTWLYSSMSMTAATMCFSPTRTYIFNLQPQDFSCRSPSIVDINLEQYAALDDEVYLRCVGEGDPAPVVEWTDPSSEAVTMSPNMNRTHHKTYNTWLLSKVRIANTGNYTCCAHNVKGQVCEVTHLVVSSSSPPTTQPEMPTTTPELEQTIYNRPSTEESPRKTTAASGEANSSTGSKIETTAELAPVNSHSSKTTAMTSTMRVQGSNNQKSLSQRTLAIVIGVVGSFIILIFIITIAIHICRHNRYRRRYDVNDKSIIYHPDTHELDISKDSKQIQV